MCFEENFSEIYDFSDWATNTERGEIGGKEIEILLPSFNLLRRSLIQMEAMARDIELGNIRTGFTVERDNRNKPVVRANEFGRRYFFQLDKFYQKFAFDQRYAYSPHVSAVSEALAALRLQPSSFKFRAPEDYDVVTRKAKAEVFNEVVAKVADILASSTFKERLRVRKRGALRNQEKALTIEQKVFANKSRHLVLMLHFGYQKQYRPEITFEECQKHRKKFFNNCRSNSLLRGIVDYIWKMEEGDDSGLHLHLLIFYTAESCRDVYIAKKIGEYWVKITDGKGQYWNSNAHKAFHERHGHGIGTGEINWNDEAKREAVRKNIRYMTKAEQFLKMKRGKRYHLFGTSEVAEKKRAGRPRSVLPKLDVAGNALEC